VTNLVAIPPLARTIIYYVLALAFAAIGPLTAAGRVDALYGAIILGVAGVFGFTLAASNVARPTVDVAPPAGE
jgi:hypothetical protein